MLQNIVEYRKGTKDVFISLEGLSTGKPKKSREERVWKDTFWHLSLSSSCVYSPYFRNNTQVVKEAKKPAWGRREQGGEGKQGRREQKKTFPIGLLLPPLLLWWVAVAGERERSFES